MTISNQLIAPDGYVVNGMIINGMSGSAVPVNFLTARQVNIPVRKSRQTGATRSVSLPYIILNIKKLTQKGITVHNNLTTNHNGTSIHWHGMRQFMTNWEDGVAGVTQCPIMVSRIHLYE